MLHSQSSLRSWIYKLTEKLWYGFTASNLIALFSNGVPSCAVLNEWNQKPIIFCLKKKVDWIHKTSKLEKKKSEILRMSDFSQLTTYRHIHPHPRPFPQMWLDLHERCPKCWNEWKINFSISVMYSFSRYNRSNLTIWLKKSWSQMMRNVLNRFFLYTSFFSIFSLWVIVDLLFYLRSAFRTYMNSDFFLYYGGSATRFRMLLDWIPLVNWLSGITG